jgi:cell division protein FtsW
MKKIDYILLITVIVFVLFGLLMIYNTSSVIAFRDFGDKYRYIKDQLVWAVLGFGALSFFSVFNYKKLYNLSLPLLITTIALLIAVFIPGLGAGSILGAHRWINIGFTTLQPAELVKLFLAIYLAAWFSMKEKGRLPAFLLLIGVVISLIMMQPDLGTATIILFEAIILYYLSGGEISYFIIGAPIVAIGGFILVKLEPYRAARLTTFLNIHKALEVGAQASDPALWHIRQILIALGSGGIFGVGLGNSLQKYAYLPENVTDSIFPIIAEELGFVGSVVLISLCMVLIWRGFVIAAHTKDTFGKLLAAGIISFLGIQMVINLGAMTALFPLTGVPLPFISYGGSALVVDLASIGILLNISKHIS